MPPRLDGSQSTPYTFSATMGSDHLEEFCKSLPRRIPVLALPCMLPSRSSAVAMARFPGPSVMGLSGVETITPGLDVAHGQSSCAGICRRLPLCSTDRAAWVHLRVMWAASSSERQGSGFSPKTYAVFHPGQRVTQRKLCAGHEQTRPYRQSFVQGDPQIAKASQSARSIRCVRARHEPYQKDWRDAPRLLRQSPVTIATGSLILTNAASPRYRRTGVAD
jgi:hypothetical protein